MQEVILLGSAQDAGVPQIGCQCAHCTVARQQPHLKRTTVSLALVDHDNALSYVIDATPDFREQYDALRAHAPHCALGGIIISHAHIGHYTGLIHLGKEAMSAHDVPLHASESVCAFLRNNAPWSQLVQLNNIALQPFAQTLSLGAFSIQPISVPHRAEYSDTHAFIIRAGERSFFYCPDIDRWEQWRLDVREVVSGVDVALIDGCFFANGELPGRDMSKIPHPLVTDSVQRLSGVRSEVVFIHLNHTNPVLHDGSECAWLHQQGFKIGSDGMRWQIA